MNEFDYGRCYKCQKELQKTTIDTTYIEKLCILCADFLANRISNITSEFLYGGN